MGQRSQRFRPQSNLVEFRLDGKQRTALHPSVPKSEVLRETLRIVSGPQKLVGLPQVVPFLFRELDVTAVRDVVAHHDNEQGSSIG